MGRYISGHLEGKCWFGLQPSNFADRFGTTGEPSSLNYYFDRDDLPAIESELKSMEEKYGGCFDKLDKFFNTHDAYDNEEIRKLLSATSEESERILRDYADHEFGVRLRNYLRENEDCSFEVEL